MICWNRTNDWKLFQYPEGFWPDSDLGSLDVNNRDGAPVAFQYPEGFWPDSDTGTAKTPIAVPVATPVPVSVPRRVLAR